MSFTPNTDNIIIDSQLGTVDTHTIGVGTWLLYVDEKDGSHYYCVVAQVGSSVVAVICMYDCNKDGSEPDFTPNRMGSTWRLSVDSDIRKFCAKDKENVLNLNGGHGKYKVYKINADLTFYLPVHLKQNYIGTKVK